MAKRMYNLHRGEDALEVARLKAENADLKDALISIRCCLPSRSEALLEDTREEALARLSLIFEDCTEALKE